MEINNWILKKHLKNIRVVSETYLPFYKDFLREKNIIINDDLAKSHSFINWNLYANKYSFFYDYEGCEDEIQSLLKKSDLINTKSIFMDFGYNNPIIQVETKYFVDNWYDFVKGAQYESTIISEDATLIMEFIKGYDLISNFLI
jgi:hypothetical protein